MNNTPEEQDDGSSARRQVLAAAWAEIRRREAMVIKLQRLDCRGTRETRLRLSDED